jgi:hypothetical protein
MPTFLKFGRVFRSFEYDAKEASYKDDFNNIQIKSKADFYLDNNIKIVNGMINI